MKQLHILLVLVVIGLAACKKDYLDRLPNAKISEEEVFSDIGNSELFVNNIYNSVPNMFRTFWPMSSATDETDQSQDQATITADGADAGNFNSGFFTPSAFPLRGRWKDYFTQIRRCNIVLANYDKIPEDNNYPERKKRIKGEVLTMRAYYYFELLRGWGGVPLFESIQNPLGNEPILFKRNSVDEVVAAILKDLAEAELLLPANYADRQSEIGRASKTIVLGLKGRVLLYYASPLFNPANISTRWKDASDANKKALDAALAAGYQLHAKYSEIFTQFTNQEVIWGRPAPGAFGDAGIDREMNPTGYIGYARVTVLQELVDDYELKATGKRPGEQGSGYDPNHPYAGRDPRFYQSVLYPGSTWKGRKIDPLGIDAAEPGKTATNYWQRKYVLESVNLINASGDSPRRWVLMRTAEVYLNYAEAYNEAIGPDQEVYDAVNAVRARVGMPDLPSGLGREEMREKIRHERRIELAFEGQRFWDVRRWKIAETVDNKVVRGVSISVSGSDTTYTYPVIEKRIFNKAKQYFLPIPQSEIDKLGGVSSGFSQNPGY
ncbi:RagB/SusD family nutrient uptake outer membrane protein [Pedobacter nyackensis]|uniref:RagB/SusD family nutrient uptake outer membrane protein n=1 Tax=Pedobacter nyackensis TaxID=475255 RepID=UPI00292CF2CA|nr:RagB/SusD family nutrient uptake outer membrane protein [Pedobacter nyackensis]